ncbi:methyl-accepting chemotaxis protein [Alteromonas facilis]|uniref:methyl-accepting chemotaxis protein n=1 Tax=Alteromonas facilis TaxID=2048004 RepID=UPI000C28A58D|nr:methyl-accepting chemotaxis protein [Alteromonas facilis]
MTLYPWTSQANGLFKIVLIAQFLLGLFIAGFTGTWLQAVIIGGLIVAFPLVLLQTNPAAAVTRHAVGVAVQLITALHIQQTSGLIEMHFEIFVLLAFLSVYRDWQVILTSTLVVAVHHILFFILQSNGVGVYIFQEGYVTLWILAIHAGFAVAEGGVLIFTTKASEQEALSGFVLTNTIASIFKDSSRINLNVNVEGNGREIEQFRRLIEGVKTVVGSAKETSLSVLNLSEIVTDSVSKVETSLFKSTDQVNAIATAIDEMTATNDEVAKQADSVSELASSSESDVLDTKATIDSVSHDIQALNVALRDTSDTIEHLSSMCNDIDSAMAAIKSISEQTNLLALNAAIESARAGEHGRGFAVVADEVRQLSIRTSENAEDISKITAKLITEAMTSVEKVKGCVSQVESSVELSNGAGEKTLSITQSIQRLNENIETVATATEEQSKVSGSIAEASNVLLASSQEQTKEAKLSFDKIRQLRSEINALNKQLAQFDTP